MAAAPHHYTMPPVPPYPGAPTHYPPPPPTHHPHHAPPSYSLPPPSALSHGYPPPPQPPPQPNQTWVNPHWHQHHGWEYADITHNNEEDWAARARAWAAANSATESLHTQSRFNPLGKIEGQDHVYHDQYQQAIGPPFADIQQSSLPAPHQHLQDSIDDLHGRVNHLQEFSSLNPVSCSSVTNLRTYYDVRDEGLVADADNMASLPRRSFCLSTSVNMQEVPSSNSYTSGNKDFVDGNEKLQMPLPVTSVSGGLVHSQSTLPVKSNSMEQSHLMYRDQATELSTDASDQPLDFVQRPTSDHDPHQKTSYMHIDKARPMDHIVAESSLHAWTPPVASGVAFSQLPLVAQGTQFDSSFIPSSSIPGHPPGVFGGRVTGPNFRPSISPVTAPFGYAAVPSLHPSGTFPGDANEAFNLSERPKKASVPNWLRDEIIKKKAVIASSSAQEHPIGSSSQSIRADDNDKSSRKAGMDDSKSIDSRSTEDEEDDEDDVHAARSAAINQEIKRVLTDVLLKVTDELFDEIATKVLGEDEVEDHGAVSTNHKESLSLPVSTSPKASVKVTTNHKESLSLPASTSPKASAKVLVAGIANTTKVGGGGLSISESSGGNILGLANYASDEDYEETQSSSMLSSGPTDVCHHVVEGPSKNVLEQFQKRSPASVAEPTRGSLLESDINRGGGGFNGALQNSDVKDDAISASKSSPESDSAHEPKGPTVGKLSVESESAHGYANNGKSKAGVVIECGSKSDSTDKLQNKRSPENKESGMAKANWEHSGGNDLISSVDQDGMQEKMDKPVVLKQRSKDRSSKQDKNVRESESRKIVSHDSVMDDRKLSGKGKRDQTKEDDLRKKERPRNEEEDRSRQRVTKDPHRQWGRQTSSLSYRGRNSRDNSLESHSTGSGEEVSENSKKRKLRSSKQSLSPSPTRSRRQVSRSPHSKHSQRRNSPCTVDTRRKGRSRSRSPVHWRRPGYKR